MGWFRQAGALGLAALLAACASAPERPGPGPRVSSSGAARGTMRPYTVNDVTYTPRADPHYSAVGWATWYGSRYHNRKTADGEWFDENRISGAHTTLPLPCLVEVNNLENGRTLVVRLNDRGPFVGGRLLDVTPEAARRLGFYGKGQARVRVKYLGPAEPPRG